MRETGMKENASSSEVRDQMQVCSEIIINMKMAAYETVNKMKAELSDEQNNGLMSMEPRHKKNDDGKRLFRSPLIVKK